MTSAVHGRQLQTILVICFTRYYFLFFMSYSNCEQIHPLIRKGVPRSKIIKKSKYILKELLFKVLKNFMSKIDTCLLFSQKKLYLLAKNHTRFFVLVISFSPLDSAYFVP